VRAAIVVTVEEPAREGRLEERLLPKGRRRWIAGEFVADVGPRLRESCGR
jgi:hypothetical protein